ncbi:MAG: LLM class F420-dependent oxidoreductase [Deltaproteobacteria bacterium]|nr:LLM class F420-dependent oxidoreductase [Deltaproteobacteria bacterium]
MKVGLFMFPAAYAVDPASVARKAEELGFESFWLPEHPIIPVHCKTPYPLREDGKIPDFYAHIADPFIGLAGAAAVTKKIKLGTGICLVPERNPIVLAKEVATLDHYSGGRVVFGVGAGWLKEEGEVLGVDFPRRWTRLRESIQAMRELWTKEEAEFHGKVVNFPPVRCLPQPAQKPYPPTLLGAHGEKGLQRVAQWADGWCPLAPPPEEVRDNLKTLKSLTEAAGRDFSKLDISAFLGVTEASPVTDLLKRYEDVGVQRIILALGYEEGPFAFRQIRFFKPGETDGALERLAEKAQLG